MTPVLVTIPFSHYCEKARWALERAGIAFVERPHLPVFSRLGTLVRGRWSSVPMLRTDAGVLTDSTAILAWVGEQGAGFLPYPAAVAADALAWEERFDERLGPHTRRAAYSWILDNRPALVELMRQAAAPAAEKLVARAGLPVIRAGLRRALAIDAAGVARSLGRIDEAFAAVADRLADGRRYLCGEQFTAADLTFAALAAPVVAAPEYGAPLPALERLSSEGQATIARLRQHAAGAFALRLYAGDRRAAA